MRSTSSRKPRETLAQYRLLALYLNPPPPNLAAKVKDADMPPDAVAVMGILPLVQKFYETAGLHDIWEGNQQAYSALTGRYHEALAKMLFDTEIYLKLPSSTRGWAGNSRSTSIPWAHRDKPMPEITGRIIMS